MRRCIFSRIYQHRRQYCITSTHEACTGMKDLSAGSSSMARFLAGPIAPSESTNCSVACEECGNHPPAFARAIMILHAVDQVSIKIKCISAHAHKLWMPVVPAHVHVLIYIHKYMNRMYTYAHYARRKLCAFYLGARSATHTEAEPFLQMKAEKQQLSMWKVHTRPVFSEFLQPQSSVVLIARIEHFSFLKCGDVVHHAAVRLRE